MSNNETLYSGYWFTCRTFKRARDHIWWKQCMFLCVWLEFCKSLQAIQPCQAAFKWKLSTSFIKRLNEHHICPVHLKHYSDVTLASCHLKSPIRRLFVQKLKVYSGWLQRSIKARHCGTILGGNQWGPLDSHHKGSVKRKAFICYAIMKNPLKILLTHWGRVTHICVGNLTIIGSDNGLSPGRRQAIIWTNAGILLIGPLRTNFSEIVIGIQTFSFKKMHLKTSSAK